MVKKTIVFPAFTIIWLIFCFPFGTSMGAQNSSIDFQGSNITASLKETPLKNIIEEFQKEKGIWFKSPKSLLDERVSVEFENLSIREGLKRILRTMNYSFLFDKDNNIIGIFVFGKANRVRKTTDSDELNEKIVKAAMEGDTTAVNTFLAKGADVNAKGKYAGWTPLILAAKKGNTELVDFLLAHGADVNAKSNPRCRTALMEAVRNRKVETVKILLGANPDVNAVDWEGYTALMFAAISGQLDVVHELLTYGADEYVKNKTGSSALMMASGYPDIVKMLKKGGAGE